MSRLRLSLLLCLELALRLFALLVFFASLLLSLGGSLIRRLNGKLAVLLLFLLGRGNRRRSLLAFAFCLESLLLCLLLFLLLRLLGSAFLLLLESLDAILPWG